MNRRFYIAGSTEAAKFAGEFLRSAGADIAVDLHGAVDCVLLDVPSFTADGLLRSGKQIERILDYIPKGSAVIGGNLAHPALAGMRTLDLLKDEQYLAQNAYITAECALDVALPYLSITLRGCPVLILGWGRIGKCLAQILKALDAQVTVAVRKETDRAMLWALGYHAEDINRIEGINQYRLIFNTVPERMLHREHMRRCHPECVKIDLASRPGMEDDDVIIARGLPGLHFPESSGRLIADTILRKEHLL